MDAVAHLIAAVADVQARRAASSPVYRVVRRGRETSTNWAVELADIPAELLSQAQAVVDQGNRQVGFAAYDVWSF